MMDTNSLSNNDLFASTLSLSAHEVSSLVAHLDQLSHRLDTLRALRKVLKRNSNHVPQVCQQPLFVAINDILRQEKRPTVISETLWLLVDIIAGTPQIDNYISPLLPLIVQFLGDDSSDIQRASLRVVSVNMRHTSNLQKCLNYLIQYGIQSQQSKSIQKSVIKSLPLIFGDEFERENLFQLVDSLSRLLIRADNDLFYPVFLALQRIHSIVGNHVFKQYLDSTETEAKQLYESVLSRNPSADSDTCGQTQTLLERPITLPLNREESQESDNYWPLLRFGVFPVGLIHSSLEGSPDERLAAIESILQIIRESPLKTLIEMIPTMDSFLLDLIGGQLLEQNSFKITLNALDIIEALVERLKTSMSPFIPTIISVLAKRLGDGRTVVRDSVVKVIHHLMYSFPPQELLDLLLSQKPSKNPKVREEIINRVTAAVLTFPRSELNLAKLCFSVSPMLTDNRRQVRLAALECLAVLAQALGPHRLSPLISAVEAIEQTCQLDGLVIALQARLARRALPRCAADGTVRYVLNPQQFSGWFTSGTEADLEWVMMATPSSHNGTPPKRKTSNGQLSGIPTTIPFDRRKQSNYGNVLLVEDREENQLIEEMGRRKSIAETNIDHLLSSGQTQDNINGSPLLQQRAPNLDSFRGVSFNSSEERRDSEDSRASSLEVWRQYFSRFRKQLAEAALFPSEEGEDNQNQNEFKVVMTTGNIQHRSDTDLPHFAQDMSESRAASPLQPQSCSAPSTASGEHPSVVTFFQPIKQITSPAFDAPNIERSMSLPSISAVHQQEEEEEEKTPEELKEMEKPSPFLATPLPPPPSVASQQQTEQREEEIKEEVNELSMRDNNDKNEPSSEPPPPTLMVQEATPLHHRRSSSSVTELQMDSTVERLDVWTQKDETLSSETSEERNIEIKRKDWKQKENKTTNRRTKRAQPIGGGRQSRSQSPQGRRRPSRPPQQIYIKTTPAIPVNANIRHILQNVAKTEGPFDSPQEAVKAAIMALQDDAWTTKVEGMLAITRLATFHANYLLKDQQKIIQRLILEVKNLRSTVSRSAIFTLGELFSKLKTQCEPEMDSMVSSLLLKSGENIVFMREDIERALNNCLEEMPQTRTALALIQGGANHRNALVRRTCAHFLSIIVERMGPIKCLLGPRDLGEHLLPCSARFVQDSNQYTRFYGRKIFQILMNHVSFDKLLRKHVTPGTYRNICGILESIKRRGVGDRPQDLISPSHQ